MNKARLEELRARVFTDYQVWDVKCSKDGFPEATPTGKMYYYGNDLTALIDAELARQSVTDDADDEEIQKAINHHEYRVGKRQEDIKVYRESKNPELMRSADMFERALCRDRIILAALRQYQKPTDEAVRSAIEDLLSGVECADELTDEEYIEAHLSPQGHELAIQALRQYQKPSDAEVAEAVEVQQRINHTRDNIARMVLMEWAQPAKAIQQSTALAIQCMRQMKPTDEAVRDAISWLESDKIDRQREWEKQDTEWKLEQGAKEMHDSFMASFDLAIQALCQMRTEQVTNVIQDSLQDGKRGMTDDKT